MNRTTFDKTFPIYIKWVIQSQKDKNPNKKLKQIFFLSFVYVDVPVGVCEYPRVQVQVQVPVEA